MQAWAEAEVKNPRQCGGELGCEHHPSASPQGGPQWPGLPDQPAPMGGGTRAGQLRQALMEPMAGQQDLGRSSVCLPHRPFIFGRLPAASPLATSCFFPSPSSQAQLLKCPQISCLSFLWSLSRTSFLLM